MNTYSTIVEYRFFLTTHKGMLMKTDHALGLEASRNKFQGAGNIEIIFSNHNEIKLEINKRAIARKTLSF